MPHQRSVGRPRLLVMTLVGLLVLPLATLQGAPAWATSPTETTTTVEVTGPHRATTGDEVTLTAAVQPAGASGTITFTVDGALAATADVDAGAASAPYTFDSEGDLHVVANFEPADPEAYESSSTSHSVHVEPGTTAESPPEPVATEDDTMTVGSTCGSAGRTGSGTAAQAGPVPPFVPITGLVQFFASIFYNALTFFGNLVLQTANTIAMFFKVGPCAVGRQASSAKPLHGKVECLLTVTGYQCPLYLHAFSTLSLRFAVPMPAALAGKHVKLKPTLSLVDPETGALTTRKGTPTTVDVPERTVLAARLAPAKRDRIAVQGGHQVTYRLLVRNTGIVRADRVRTCVAIGKGAAVVHAKHADVRGRRACWTLPSLKKGASATRRLTLVAPRKADSVRLVATVTPRKSQAEPIRLVDRLDVR